MATYWVEAGHGGTNSGTEANPWLTIDQAMNAVAADDVVNVKASAAYPEIATIDTVGTIAAPIIFRGHTSAVGDRGKATIDGGSARANCIADSLGVVGGYYVFENFIMSDATGNGVGSSLNQLTFKNCEFNSNGGDGVNMGNGALVESCIFSGNTGDGLQAGTTCGVYGSRFLGGVDGAKIGHGVVVDCVFYNQSGNAIEFVGANGFNCTVYGCVVDGNGKTTNTGVKFPGALWGPYVLINTIIYDCTNGVTGHNNGGGRLISRNNLLNSNTADYGAGYETFVGEVTAAPAFTAEASQDYTLAGGSPARDVGFDGYETAGATQGRNIGAHETAAGAGGGGLLMPNKRGNKQ